ncbi:urease accessory protein UreD [Curvibacter sp. RS43]|uniref:Urease accessory protein UreD n=1 Tax=Curvibacter microcysteis TaxID=3026419 RepID=A0ABT5MGL3_9BURK|nr:MULTISPECIES: urease accessory protein UreD [unclassified Curvibacter]MDD0810537.1 urease accessory protein UreD [Curvibacter sp. RS43]MDD0815726.1 urease accessory protein UreD [Curvibacter sp. HBC28]
MSWHARLDLQYTFEAQRTAARFQHDGPLRILQSLYPEGPICHNVLVHPPGGLVGGDTLDITVQVAEGAHGLVTTPGATRFYRSLGEPALQRARLDLAAGARLEWLPLEAIAYNQCLARNELHLRLAPGAEMMGWDITALGLPHAKQPFEQGEFAQHIELDGVWLERGRIAASDHRLLQSPLGLAGQRCVGSLFFIAGSALSRERRELGLDLARHALEPHTLRDLAGATCPNDQVMVVRVLGPQVEPVMQLLRAVWASWRAGLWQLPATPPRIWAM